MCYTERLKIGCVKERFKTLDIVNDFEYGVQTTYYYGMVNA